MLLLDPSSTSGRFGEETYMVWVRRAKNDFYMSEEKNSKEHFVRLELMSAPRIRAKVLASPLLVVYPSREIKLSLPFKKNHLRH
jgi:hypothetical protein